MNRLIDTGRHVYANWLPILGRRCRDDRVSPWNDHEIDYVDACPTTTAILERTCSVSLDPDVPLPIMRRVAKTMAAAPAPARTSTRDERPAAG